MDRNSKIFQNPITKILLEHFPGFKIDRDGKDLVAQMMFQIHSKLMRSFTREVESSSNSILGCVQDAVGKVLSTEILRHALAEASRKLLLFQRGVTAYDHVSSLKRFTTVGIFKDGIKTLLSTGASPVPEFTDSDKKFAEILSTTADFLSSKVANYSSRQESKEIGGEQVMEVLKEVLPKNLFEHAKLRVNNNVRDFQMGLISEVDRRAPVKKERRKKYPSRKSPKSVRRRSKGRQPSISEAKSITQRKRKRTVSAKQSATRKRRTVRQEITPKRKIPSRKIRKSQKPSVLRSKSPKTIRATRRLKSPYKAIRSDVVKRTVKRERSVGKSTVRRRTKSGRQPSKRRKLSATAAKSVTQRDRKRTVSTKKSTRPKSRTLRRGVSPKRRLQRKTIHKSQKSVGKSKSPKALRDTERVKSPSKVTQRGEKVKPFDFSSGISVIFTMISGLPPDSMGSEGKGRINNFLVDVFESLMHECATLKSPQTPETIRSSAEKILPSRTSRLAIAHANRKISVAVALKQT